MIFLICTGSAFTNAKGVVRCSSSFICLSAGAGEWQPCCLATILVHSAPPEVQSIQVLIVIFGGYVKLIVILVCVHRLHLLATSLTFPIAFISHCSLCCIMLTVHDFKLVDCGHEHTLLRHSIFLQVNWSFWLIIIIIGTICT